MSSLADKIDGLFTTIRTKGREYTYEEVARGCSELSGGTFSKTYVWQLRTGQRDNPTKRHLEALAAFFHVPVAYFFDDEVAARMESQFALATAMRDADVRDVALRIINLDDQTRKSMVRIVQEITQMRQPTADPGQVGGS
ncbi:XRE family transcriptional regulator [Streptomyces lydicus]|nr:XRE family transcriptional regulator [Streptomyces lydicus]